MKPKDEYPYTKTRIAKETRIRGAALEAALPSPDWTSKSGKVKRWKEKPELPEISAAYGPEIRYCVTFGSPSGAWLIGPTGKVVAVCKEYVRRAFEIRLGKEKEFFLNIAKTHGLIA